MAKGQVRAAEQQLLRELHATMGERLLALSEKRQMSADNRRKLDDALGI